jgi:SAM-dependent methyltransferase
MISNKETHKNSEYWDNFYKNQKVNPESSFCNKVRKTLQGDFVVVDIGCGLGRDSFSFATEGYDVFGIDGSIEAISANKKRAEENPPNGAVYFSKADLRDRKSLQELFSRVTKKAELENKKIVLYLRFLLHAIDEETEKVLLDALADDTPVGTYFAAEFRTAEDAAKSKVYDDHYRRFVETDKFLVELITRGFSVNEFYKGTGLSIYKDEDPFLARVMAVKR